MSHPSDLILEQYLHGEPVSPSVARHVETCEDCWRRWEHLHADEGLAPPVRAVLPEAANSTNWAWFAGGAGLSAAVAAAVILTLGVNDDAATVLQLEQQVETLRSEVRELTKQEGLRTKQAALSKDSLGLGSGENAMMNQAEAGQPSSVAGGGRTAITESSEITAKGGGAAGSDKLTKSQMSEEERLSRLHAAMNKHSELVLTRLDTWLDDLVDMTKLDEAAAQQVVDLIQNELIETTTLKEDAKLGHLTGMEAREDWGVLRQETNAALLEVLGDESLVKDLRQVTDAKK